MAVQHNTITELSTSTMNKMLVSLLNGTSSQQDMGKPSDGMGGTVKRLAAKIIFHKVCTNQIQTLINYSITATAKYTTLYSFVSKKNKFRRKL
jgi:hypothetical protein